MIEAMRRLHPRGRDCRGLVVDAEGAMLGPDCMLVRRTPVGFRCLAPDEAAAIQAAVLGPECEADWLFEQTGRIAEALAKGETALAQIYELRIPLGDLDGTSLRRLAAAARLVKANFDPNQPRVPAGNPDGGQWTDAGGFEDAPAPSGTSGGGEGWPEEAGDDEGWPESDAGPPIEDSPNIPSEPPATARERNRIVRDTAHWLRQAAALGAAFAPEPRVKAVLLAVEATAWVVEYLPEIRSYLDQPRSLSELQDAAIDGRPGYQTHHIVERHYGSNNPLRNSLLFGDRLESRENLVQIPKWRHVEISTWYSKPNDAYGMTPRAYLRGRGWNEQYEIGLDALRRFGVLK